MIATAASRTMLAGAAALVGLGACATGEVSSATPSSSATTSDRGVRIAGELGAVPQITGEPADAPQVAEFLDVCGAALVSPRAAADKLLDRGWDVTIRAPGGSGVVVSGRDPDRGMWMLSVDRTVHHLSTRCWPSYSNAKFDEADLAAAAERLGLVQDRTGAAPGTPLDSWSGPAADDGVITISTRALSDDRMLTLVHQRWLEPTDEIPRLSLPLTTPENADRFLAEFLLTCSTELGSEDFAPREDGRFPLGQKVFGDRIERGCRGGISPVEPMKMDLTAVRDLPGLQEVSSIPGGEGATMQGGRWSGVTEDGRYLAIQITEIANDKANLITVMMTLTGEALAADDEERT